MAAASDRLSTGELQALMERALQFRRDRGFADSKVLLPAFYRNKPSEYFQAIRNAGGLMRPRLMGPGGDPRSVLTGNISGVFFSALLHTDTLQPPVQSNFGDKRLFIPAHELFTEESRLYFADFYCLYNQNHYVTLVLTRQGSAADRFCRARLIALDPRANSFLTREGTDDEVKVYTTLCDKMYIEVMYTEPININDLLQNGAATLVRCGIVWPGQANPNGLLKDPTCGICNL